MQDRPYTRLQKRLHLAVVALVAVDVLFQGAMTRAFRHGLASGEFTLIPSSLMHFLAGVVVLLLVLLRLTLVREQGGGSGGWSTWPYRALYGLLILVSVSGVMAWGLGSATMGRVHHVLSLALYSVVVLHVAGRLIAAIMFGNSSLARMFSGLR